MKHDLTLGELWTKYSTECAEYLDNKVRTKESAELSARVLLAYFGADFCVEDLSREHQRAFEQKRMAGGIKIRHFWGGATKPTRARSADADVIVLHAMLLWATTVKIGRRRYLLNRNPLAGVRRIHEKNPKQPVATWERYQATMSAMRRLRADANDLIVQTRWLRMEFALFMAERTGRRLGSIRALRWEDFSRKRRILFWRAEADKKGYKWEVRMPERFFDEIHRYRELFGHPSGLVFPANSKDGIMDRHLFDKWLAVAEREAGVPKLDGGLWHCYRRKWAIERKHLPLKDVAAAGGWKDTATLLEIYQQPDDTGVLAVMSERRKLHDHGLSRPRRSR